MSKLFNFKIIEPRFSFDGKVYDEFEVKLLPKDTVVLAFSTIDDPKPVYIAARTSDDLRPFYTMYDILKNTIYEPYTDMWGAGKLYYKFLAFLHDPDYYYEILRDPLLNKNLLETVKKLSIPYITSS